MIAGNYLIIQTIEPQCLHPAGWIYRSRFTSFLRSCHRRSSSRLASRRGYRGRLGALGWESVASVRCMVAMSVRADDLRSGLVEAVVATAVGMVDRHLSKNLRSRPWSKSALSRRSPECTSYLERLGGIVSVDFLMVKLPSRNLICVLRGVLELEDYAERWQGRRSYIQVANDAVKRCRPGGAANSRVVPT